jgi:hypothetical protein
MTTPKSGILMSDPRGGKNFELGPTVSEGPGPAILRRMANLGTPHIMQAKNWPLLCHDDEIVTA